MMDDTLFSQLEDGSFWDDEEAAHDFASGLAEASGRQNCAAGAGMWMLHDDGTFELLEPYRSKLEEAKIVATKAWAEALVAYLVENSPYTAQELIDELTKRNSERTESKMTVFEEFVLEALSGDL